MEYDEIEEPTSSFLLTLVGFLEYGVGPAIGRRKSLELIGMVNDMVYEAEKIRIAYKEPSYYEIELFNPDRYDPYDNLFLYEAEEDGEEKTCAIVASKTKLHEEQSKYRLFSIYSSDKESQKTFRIDMDTLSPKIRAFRVDSYYMLVEMTLIKKDKELIIYIEDGWTDVHMDLLRGLIALWIDGRATSSDVAWSVVIISKEV